jgi:CPA2 family monovalent cation:H+ antiporter-2
MATCGRRRRSIEGRALVIGFGPTGRTVSRLLRENAILPTIVDLNLDTIFECDAGGSTIYGDARHPGTLVTAGIRHAGTLILSGSDTAAPEIIRVARAASIRACTPSCAATICATCPS